MTLRFPCRDLAKRAPTIAERRSLFRGEMRGRGYTGRWQLLLVVAIAAAPVVAGVWSVEGWGMLELVVGLVAVAVSCSTVYALHRFPMHRVYRGLEIVYDMHTRCHHMIFNEEEIEIESMEDLDMVMLPPSFAAVLCWVVLPLIAAPLAAVHLDAALVFMAVANAYYLAYELVHLASHLRVGGPWDRVPGLGWLLRHHRRHHAWEDMHHANFSMLIPVWDFVFGTHRG